MPFLHGSSGLGDERDVRDNLDARGVAAIPNVKTAIQAQHALAQAADAKASRPHPISGQAASVVDDAHCHVVVVSSDADRNFVGLSVSQRVHECFLYDSIERDRKSTRLNSSHV